jgi:hypothetical protein
VNQMSKSTAYSGRFGQLKRIIANASTIVKLPRT